MCGALSPGAHPGGFNGQDAHSGHLVAHTLRAEGFDASEDGTGRGIPLGADPITANEQRTYTHEGTTFRLRNVVPVDLKNVTSKTNRSNPQPGDPCHTLHSGAEQAAVAYGIRADASRDGVAKVDSPDATGRLRKRDAGFNVYQEESPTLDAAAPQSVGTAAGVRRLTPTECERLQAFPDGWTATGQYPDGKRELSDSARYRALGNAVTANVAHWIARRIVAAVRKEAAA